MKELGRITPAMLDVLGVLVWSPDDLHGFAMAKAAGRPTGSVYVILSRLEDAGMVDSYWEDVGPHNEGRPRRRFYHLNPEGLGAARQILAERGWQPRREPSISRRTRRHLGREPQGRLG